VIFIPASSSHLDCFGFLKDMIPLCLLVKYLVVMIDKYALGRWSLLTLRVIVVGEHVNGIASQKGARLPP